MEENKKSELEKFVKSMQNKLELSEKQQESLELLVQLKSRAICLSRFMFVNKLYNKFEKRDIEKLEDSLDYFLYNIEQEIKKIIKD